jgi:hypothetical protein
VTGGIIFVDIVFNFHTGFVARHALQEQLVMDGRQVQLPLQNPKP